MKRTRVSTANRKMMTTIEPGASEHNVERDDFQRDGLGEG